MVGKHLFRIYHEIWCPMIERLTGHVLAKVC
jgi:hypothetical protein